MDVISQSVQVPYSAPEKLQQLNTHFHTQSAEDILGWATTQFGAQIVLTCSFGGASGMVLLDMVARIARDTPVVFLDTGLLFPETYALVAEAERHYGIVIQQRQPALSLEAQPRKKARSCMHATQIAAATSAK